MNHPLSLRAGRLVLASFVLGGFAVAGGCVVEESDPRSPGDDDPPITSTPDGGGRTDGGSTLGDAGSDANANEDACADGGCAPAQGCALFPEASFCDDFDDPEALAPNKTKWDFLEPTDQPVLTLSTAQAVSHPHALLSRVIDKDTPGAKFAKTVTKAGFTEVTWAYDVYLEAIGNDDGFFLDDFQFTDDAGADTFGFRLVMFSLEGAIKELKVEHNRQVTGGDYVIEPPLPDGVVSLGAWHHFEQTVKFTFADAEADGGAEDKVEYTLRIDNAATPAFQKEYPGPAREHVDFARIAGMPLVFNKEKSAGLKIHWDNHVLELK